MGRFVLVRHASPRSAAREAGLSESGRAEAAALARRLAAWPFDAAWSSDLPRALETAESILAGRVQPPLRTSAALREVELPLGLPSPAADLEGYGAWEREAVATLAEALTRWRGGVEAPDGRILVVSHAGPLRVLICLLLGLPAEAHWRFRLERASLTVVDAAEDMGTLLLLNDACHLEGATRGR